MTAATPEFVPVFDLDRVPSEVSNSSRAAVWNLEERDGKPTRIPYVSRRPNERASVSDPTTSGPFNEARAAVEDDRTHCLLSEIATTLMMYSGKSHWHSRPDVVVEYVATDSTLAKILRGGRDGATGRTTFAPDDCLDCHSRPAHTLASTPAQVVDRAIARGEISTTMPFVRSEMVEALGEEHPAGTDASQAIVQRLTKVFGTATPEAVQAVQVADRLYRENVFPKMNITWGTYTDQLFHVNDTGCLLMDMSDLVAMLVESESEKAA